MYVCVGIRMHTYIFPYKLLKVYLGKWDSLPMSFVFHMKQKYIDYVLSG